LNTPDRSAFAGAMRPGTACADAPLLVGTRPGWLLDHLGHGFALLCFGALPAQAVAALQGAAVPIRPLVIGHHLHDHQGVLAQRYDAQPGTCYLIRPDQHVAARWRSFDAPAVHAALRRALALPAEN
jgi:3-(3-hydroxy-phenyl)propionate hydroxylase